VQLTDDSVQALTPTWSPDGSQIVFHTPIGTPTGFQLFRINADGTGLTQITTPPGINGWAKYGVIGDVDGGNA
jgi:Tol biopolymer transport system component